MKFNISLLIGLKNNLDYNKHFYKTTRELYPNVEICFVSYGSTDGTHEWLDSLTDDNLKYFYSKEDKTFSDTFNKAAELATNDYVAYLHNDIVLAPEFLENIQKYIGENNIVSYTTIEPPIFSDHERPGKIIYDLGIDLQSFDKHKLYDFVKNKQIEYNNKTEPGVTFFMCMPKNILLNIGGMDNLFNPMFCEDDDLILRFKLLGLNCFTSLDAICYHFVSKTSRFSDEYKERTNQIEIKSNRNFVRKWGFRNSHHNVKYDIGFVIKNCSPQLLEVLEPWCSTIYIENFNNIGKQYIEKEQLNTKFNLQERIKPYDNKKQNEVIISFDANQLNQNNFQLILQQLSDIIKDNGEIGSFELDIFKIDIIQMNEYQNKLINL
jgi:GT2 family glycosyltransferase